MKASALITRITGMSWLWKAIRILALATVFGYLYTRGVSPVWAALAIVFFRGFLRFLYKIACIIVAAALLFAIISGLIF
jgi:hypothetical protein